MRNRSFRPEIRRIRCFGHVLNLAVQAFLFGPKKGKWKEVNKEEQAAINEALRQVALLLKKEPSGEESDKEKLTDEWRKHGVLGKLQNLVVYFRSSTQLYQAL